MAITKIHPIKSTLKKAIDYIVDPAKTDDKLLVSSFGCAVETADLEFEKTRLLAMQKGNNLAHHLIQAFEPGEVSYAQAHEIGRQLADEILGGKYQYVIATHINKEHCHNHIIHRKITGKNVSSRSHLLEVYFKQFLIIVFRKPFNNIRFSSLSGSLYNKTFFIFCINPIFY